MPHIPLPEHLPTGLLEYRLDTALPIRDLTQILLRGESTLTQGERELIATYVSSQNECVFCQTIHGAVASAYLGDEDWSFVNAVKEDYEQTPLTNKMKALLAIAGSVQKGGKNVTSEQVEAARHEGATDKDIHDTVLIAAAFCMFNRYVDGLATVAPSDPNIYRYRAARITQKGYSAEGEYTPQAT
jgi:uncharacterized peroxidase-related enzyme